MKTLSHLQNEAIERFEKQFACVKETDQHYYNPWLPDVKNFLKIELETIVKESFKNTRVEEKEMLDYDEQSIWTINQTRQLYNSALSDKHNKECEFLGK